MGNVYDLSFITNPHTNTCAHTPTRVSLSLGRETLSWTVLHCSTQNVMVIWRPHPRNGGGGLTPSPSLSRLCGSRWSASERKVSAIFTPAIGDLPPPTPLSLSCSSLQPLNWLAPRLFQPLPPRRSARVRGARRATKPHLYAGCSVFFVRLPTPLGHLTFKSYV